ncbi:phage GP46 family protein [Rhodopseudomonas sp. B29]|uniref:phage GP46 family protein n=1 Tax=Rhodopseudomonas sp. B29 TaxID=95607 RepID=UPI000348F9CD|nr:phage GP46 family protein [Rhodopseudomonas sp. B29]
MAEVVIRKAEGCAEESNVVWDSVWVPERGVADWAMADADETANRGGLRAKQAIATAVVLCLFTDKRVDPDHPLAYLADGDVGGYFGDSVDVREDLYEGALGSHLWLLRRAPLTIRGIPATRWAEQFAAEALAPLQAQGAVVRIDVAATQSEMRNQLFLDVRLYGRDGENVHDRKYDVLWNQVAL